MGKELNVYKHKIDGDRIAFTICHSAIAAEMILIDAGFKPQGLVNFKPISQVNKAPNKGGIWKVTKGVTGE